MGARVSILMPAYNAEATILESIESALAQTMGDFELVIVDDGSRTPVREVLSDVRDERIRIVEHPQNRGLGPTRNTLLRSALTPLVAHLDADDLWEPGYLEAVLPCFADPQVALAYTNTLVFGDEDRIYITDPAGHPQDHFPSLALRNEIPNCAITVRKAAIEQVGGYAEFAWGAMDWYLYLRLAGSGWRFAYVDRVLTRYRWSDASMSQDWDKVQKSNLQVLTRFMLHHPLRRGAHRHAARLAWIRAAKRVPGVKQVKRTLDARKAG